MQQIITRKHWIFDMDGTLTLAIHDFDGIRTQLGLPRDKPILEALAELPKAEANKLMQHLDRIESDYAQQAQAAPNALRLLSTLSQMGKRLGILTRNSFANALETLEACGLLGFFATKDIICRDNSEPKPSPDGIHLLLNNWSAKNTDTVMVGDYLFDLQAGNNAGVSTLYIDSHAQFPFAEHADVCISDLNQVLSGFEQQRVEG